MRSKKTQKVTLHYFMLNDMGKLKKERKKERQKERKKDRAAIPPDLVRAGPASQCW